MRVHLSNSMYGVLDYAAYPLGMLVVTPVVLHHLGAPAYGLWSVATAAVSAGGIIASGFGDANIQYVATLRTSGDREAIGDAVRSMMSINLALGLLLAALGWVVSPFVARRLGIGGTLEQKTCLFVLRIASALMLVRALETVCVSTLRAYERYGAAIQISLAARLLSLGAAALLARSGQGIASIMIVTAVLISLGTAAQFLRLYHFLGATSFWPMLDREAMRALWGLGIFSWLQAAAGVIFGQVDRLLVGVSMGAAAVASYALCVQLSQPIFGLTAAALHFLFPYLSGRIGTVSRAELKRTLLLSFGCNLLLIVCGTSLLLVFGEHILRAWAGDAIAQATTGVFPAVVLGSSLLGLNATGTYALMALGRFRTVAWFSVLGGAVLLPLMWWLSRTQGISGLADARLGYGAFSLLLYVPLLRHLGSRSNAISSAAPIQELKEVTQP